MEVFNLILVQPIINFLIVLSSVLFHNFGLAIISMTIAIRLVILPLTMKQLRSSKKMTDTMRELQPKIQQIQKKYAKDRVKLQQEQMKLYKEAGINPLGCLASPMLITMLLQMPIFIAVYRAVIETMATTPQDFLGLSERLYSWPIVQHALPASDRFLWLNLAKPDAFFLIPLLVVGATWISQKMMAQPGSDPKQQSMQGMMQLMMPLMFGFITFSLPSGLGLYFLTTTIIGIITQYYIYGWGNIGWGNFSLSKIFSRTPATSEKQGDQKKEARFSKSKPDDIVLEKVSSQKPKEGASHGKSGDKRKDS